jgi:hypothetical protein
MWVFALRGGQLSLAFNFQETPKQQEGSGEEKFWCQIRLQA